MPGPLDALKNAQSIGPSDYPTDPTVLDRAVEALRGFIGFGNGSQSSRFGELLGAAAPIGMGIANKLPLARFISSPTGETIEHPAMKALTEMLGSAPEPIDPNRIALGERIGSYYAPHRALVAPPEGFEFPQEMGQPWISRSQPQIDEYVSQRKVFDNPSSSLLKPPRSGTRAIDRVPSGFESKFTLGQDDLNMGERLKGENISEALKRRGKQ